MNTRSKSGLFLIELVAVILIFSLSAALCLRIFFRSRQVEAESRNLSYASLAVQSAADCYKSANGDIVKVADLLSGSLSNGELFLYYDADWNRVFDETSSSAYVSIMELSPNEGIVTARESGSGPIFSLTVRGGIDLD